MHITDGLQNMNRRICELVPVWRRAPDASMEQSGFKPKQRG